MLNIKSRNNVCPFYGHYHFHKEVSFDFKYNRKNYTCYVENERLCVKEKGEVYIYGVLPYKNMSILTGCCSAVQIERWATRFSGPVLKAAQEFFARIGINTLQISSTTKETAYNEELKRAKFKRAYSAPVCRYPDGTSVIHWYFVHKAPIFGYTDTDKIKANFTVKGK